MEKRLLASDLYKYLVSLAEILDDVGETGAAQQVIHVSKFASGTTSELYGESRLLLPEILQIKSTRFSELDKTRLRDVIAGIEREFEKIGGG